MPGTIVVKVQERPKPQSAENKALFTLFQDLEHPIRSHSLRQIAQTIVLMTQKHKPPKTMT